MDKSFQDKVALITGAASGIGRETAIGFAAEGAKVFVSDVNEAGGLETVQMIKAAGGEAVYMAADVSQAPAVEALVQKALSEYGRLDFGINNAGIGGPFSPITKYSIEDYEKVIAINQNGVFYGMKYQIKAMLETVEQGAIVNVSSIAGLRGLANSSAYSASKHAVIGLTKTAALEYARKNIRINAVCPVFTKTPLFEQMFNIDASYEEKLLKNIPIGRYGTTKDISATILWLCSEKTKFVTGQALALDGGLTAR